ncbi:nucleoside hydrolase [Nocardia sp. R7R-8]|uniref:nucleoside hydrolase n=1 Tax=Nocardia sp. R7R-8 TaxID=3459304 RepID=UPI00403D588D
MFDRQTVVLDTDLGHDLDDALALWVAAEVVADLIVVTNDETPGHDRARYARALLDRIGRTDVPVVAGSALDGAADRFVMHSLLPEARPVHTDVVDFLASVCESSSSSIVWVGIGPVSNVAEFFITRPHHIEQIEFTMMGGWLDHYRNPSRASHNPRMDPAAFGLVLRAAHRPRCVLSTHTNTPELAVAPDSPLYTWLTAPEAPPWAELIAANATEWFAHRPSSWMNDPVTLAAALGVPAVEFGAETVRIAADGRITRDPAGRAIDVSARIDYPTILAWLARHLPLNPPP